MAIQKITYNNKVAIHTDSAIPAINKCRADDLNQIKTVVNNNADLIPSNDNLVNVGTSVDTDYKTNLLYSVNLFDNSFIIGDFAGQNTTIRVRSNQILFLKAGTYTFSTTLDTSTYNYLIGWNDNMFPTSTTTENTGWKTTPSTTITLNADKYVGFLIRKADNSTINIDDIKDYNYQIEKGSTATTYEPFIQNTINVNNEKYSDTINVGTEINDKNRVNVLYSHNLFDKNNAVLLDGTVPTGSGAIAQADKNRTTYIACKPNTTYTIQKRNDGNTNRFAIATTTEVPAINTITYQNIADNSASSLTITTNATAKYLVVFFYRTDETVYTLQQGIDALQIEEGETATTYEPYITPSINVDGEEIYSKDDKYWNKGSTINLQEYLMFGAGVSSGAVVCLLDLGKPINPNITANDITITTTYASARYNGTSTDLSSFTVYKVFNETGKIRLLSNTASIPAAQVCCIFTNINIDIN